jgi:hypothetical protein
LQARGQNEGEDPERHQDQDQDLVERCQAAHAEIFGYTSIQSG